MRRTLLVAVLALVALLAGFLASTGAEYGGAPSATESAMRDHAAAQAAAPAPAAPPVPVPLARVQVRTAAETVTPQETALPVLPADRSRGALRGIAVDDEREPVPGARVRVTSDLGSYPEGLEIGDDRGVALTAVADATGEFVIEDLPSGPYTLRADSADGALSGGARIALAGQRTSARIELSRYRLASGLLVRVEDRAGAPVPGARIEALGPGDRLLQSAEADAHGRARVDAPLRGGLVVTAIAGDGRAGRAVLLDGIFREGVARGRAHQLIVVVDRPGRLVGRLAGVPAEQLVGAEVFAHWLASRDAYAYDSTFGPAVKARVQGGEFAFDAIHAGDYTLTLRSPLALRLVLEPSSEHEPLADSVSPRTAAVAAGETTRVELEVALGGAVAGTVVREDGAPVAGARVRATFAPQRSSVPDGFVIHGAQVWRMEDGPAAAHRDPETHREARTDGEGRYALAGLQPGLHRVEVLAPGLTYDRRAAVAVRDGETTALEHVLSPAGAIQGAGGATCIGVVRTGESQPVMVAVLPGHGLFTFPGMPPGAYEIGVFHSDEGQGWILAAQVQVEAGRTAWVDLRDSGPVRIMGRIVDDHGPVRGARVSLGGLAAQTSDDGSFEMRLWDPVAAAFGAPALQVEVEGIELRVPLPESVVGARAWSGEVLIGSGSVLVETRDADGKPAVATLWLAGLDNTRASLRTGSDGRRAIAHLRPGQYYLTATYPGGWQQHATFAIPSAEPSAEPAAKPGEPVVLRAKRTARLEVTAVNAHGVPEAGHEITAQTWTGEGPAPRDGDALLRSASWSVAITDADGVAALEVLPGEVRLTDVMCGVAYAASSSVPAGWEQWLRVAAGERARVALTVDSRSR